MVLIDTLLAIGQQSSIESAIELVCDKNGLVRTYNSSEWKYMFPVASEGNLLELGAGIGDDTIDLSHECHEITAVVPSTSNAELLKLRLHENDVTNCKVSVLDNLTAMPWKDGAFGGIAFEGAASAGFNLCHETLPEFAKECRRLLQPDGSVCMGISNHLHTSGPLHKLKSKLQANPHPESLNRLVKREGGRDIATLKLTEVISAMQSAGFDAPRVFAPMPDEKQTKAVLPLDAPNTTVYYFNHLMRRDTVLVRTASMLMKALARLGLIRFALPYYIVIFQLQNNSTFSKTQSD